MRVFIAEKPELARAIVAGLGNGVKQDGYYQCGEDVVTYCFGHLLSLYEPEDYGPRYKTWNLDDLPIVHIPWKYKPVADKKKQLKIIIDLIKKASLIVHAGDPDDEGQLLVDEILTFAKVKCSVKRLLINDNNLKVVQRALNNLRDNSEFRGLSNRALARSVADQLYGYNMTRAYTLAAQAKGNRGVLSVGRVQTPILGLVVVRDRLHESHQAHLYYTLTGTFTFMNGTFSAGYVPSKDAPVDDEGRILSRDLVRGIADTCRGKPAAITLKTSEEKDESAPLPYNLLRLQAECHRRFGLSPDRVKDVTQTLREKYQLITYNRSDCEYLSDEQHIDAPQVLHAITKNSGLLRAAGGKANPKIKSRAFNSKNVSAHHAIIPTSRVYDVSQLPADERNVYELIARMYLAQFYPPEHYRADAVEVVCEGHTFRATNRVMLSPGWRVLYRSDESGTKGAGDTSPSSDLSPFKNRDKGTCKDLTIDEKKTKPLPRYTIATLLKDLTRVAKYVTEPRLRELLKDKDKEKKGEHGGIGTPSTRDVIIKNLIERGYLVESGKHIMSTELGRKFYDLLPDSARTPDMTALWHEEQSAIAAGNRTVDEFLSDLVTFIAKEVSQIQEHGLSFTVDREPCPICKKGVLLKRKGSNGLFWGCSRYPDCKASYPNVRGKPDLTPQLQLVPSDTYHCEKCGMPLIRRPAKKGSGFWWGCSGYPACTERYFDSNGKPMHRAGDADQKKKNGTREG